MGSFVALKKFSRHGKDVLELTRTKATIDEQTLHKQIENRCSYSGRRIRKWNIPMRS
jgi:hypothetical protein